MAPDYDNEVKNGLAKVNEKVRRGFENSMVMKDQKVKKVQDSRYSAKNDIESIRKDQEDKQMGQWSSYIVKMNEQQKRMKLRNKTAKE